MDSLDDVRWRAVEDRDAEQDGIFVYAVRTTGVYCRPGCGSRRPLRRNVEFFPTAQAAEAATFRACRRCRPDTPRAGDATRAAVVRACRLVEAADANVSVASIAREVGLSERHLRRLFLETVGVNVGAYQRATRAARARIALRSGASVTAAVADSGYGSFRAFYEHGAPTLGMAPARYRDGGRGERLGYTSVTTPWGVAVAAATARGLCFVRLGPDEAALAEELAAEFPHAAIERDDDALSDVARALAGAVRGASDPALLPLDLEGTAFQVRVWEALRTIPWGETRTYSQVAAQIGRPSAVRAVASACAANPVALAVPCHRVVRTDGSLGGYRWGLEIKESLLTAESAGSDRLVEHG